MHSRNAGSVLVTGAAGFIGSNLVRHLLTAWPDQHIVALDALTYSGSLASLRDVLDSPNLTFVEANICDAPVIDALFDEYSFTGVLHLAAESHVDRSIASPMVFIDTNVGGTATLLRAADRTWSAAPGRRFLHVSTDEVFGSLDDDGAFNESSPYRPNSPYAASKASSDHLVRAWGETYGLPYVITNCSNNYGPYQFPEKLIPLVIDRATRGEAVPVYGAGLNVRDWLYVEDHCRALRLVFEEGDDRQTYCIGGSSERTNIDLVTMVIDEVDRQLGRAAGSSRELIEHVADRPGHDHRYAIDSTFIQSSLGWKPEVSLEDGIASTVTWYISNTDWMEAVSSEHHVEFQREWYDNRRGSS